MAPNQVGFSGFYFSFGLGNGFDRMFKKPVAALVDSGKGTGASTGPAGFAIGFSVGVILKKRIS